MELNGRPPTLDEIKALGLTNYGHFTTMLVSAGRVRGLSLHLERLARDCDRLFGVDLDLDRVRRLVRRGAERGPQRTIVRVTVYDPDLGLGNIGQVATPQVLVTQRAAADTAHAPLKLRAARYSRESPEVKHIALFGALQQRRQAQQDGYDDVVFLNADGSISEIATSNIGFVRGDEIVWPRSEWLSGVTMTLINQELDAPVGIEAITSADFAEFDAVFATNAAVGVRSVGVIDDKSWTTDHPKLCEISAMYEGIPGELL